MTTPDLKPCNGCNVCCVAPSIGNHEVEYPIIEPKPAGEACSHLGPCGGCSCYESRPSICRNYACLYALGMDRHWPQDTGVCWTFQPVNGIPDPNLLLLVGHSTHDTVEEAQKVSEVMDVIRNWLPRRIQSPFRLFGVTLRTVNDVKCFMIRKNDGRRLYVNADVAKIDQSDPLRQALKPGTEGIEKNALIIRL